MASAELPESRVKVFISYSRTDKAFASDLVLGLAACGFAPYIDREDIAAGEDWVKRLSGLISEADTIVYVASPESVKSDQCSWELKEALRLAEQALEADPSEEALERITEIQGRLARAAEALTLPTH